MCGDMGERPLGDQALRRREVIRTSGTPGTGRLHRVQGAVTAGGAISRVEHRPAGAAGDCLLRASMTARMPLGYRQHTPDQLASRHSSQLR
jgi:hypothetical protein